MTPLLGGGADGAGSGGRSGSRSPAHSAVHGHIGQPVRMAVLLPQNMLNLEVVKPRNTALGLLVERAEFGAVYAILTLDLLDHQLRIGDDPQTLVAVGDSKLQRCQQGGVLGEVIGVHTQELAQFGQDFSCRVLDIDAEAGRTRVAARPAVAVRDNAFAGVFE